jgi:glycosyltransferase involved in cell wall biosynthesis
LLFSDGIALDCPLVLRRFLAPYRVLRWIHARRDQFDVVELHEPLAAPYAFARRWIRSLPPLVVLSHGLEERGHLATLDYRRAKKLPVPLSRRLLPFSVVWQARYAVRHANHVLCCNQDDIAFLIDQGIPANRVSCNVNAVSESFLAAAAPRGESRLGWLFIGSWIMRKGTLDLVPAMSAVLRRHRTWHFTIAGTGGDTAWVNAIVQAFSDDVRDQVRPIPQITDDEMLAGICRSHAVFVLPSFYEGQPLVILEAGAAEMAIVTTNVSGMKDFIRDGDNGRLVPVGDPAALERTLERAMDEAPRLGPQARADVQAGHLWRHAAQRLLDAYRRAIEDA